MIYLASSSPRRAELLKQIGVKFTIVKVNIDESPGDVESVKHLVTRLSREKAIQGIQQIPNLQNNDLVLAADTLIHVNGKIIGKPSSFAHCCSILQDLSGRKHTVVTAVAVANREGLVDDSCGENEITFKNLEQQEIEQYCRSEEPADKAGAYAIQGKAAIFIQHMAGSYSAVMGLPLFETARLLKEAGYNMTLDNNYDEQ